MIEDAYEERAVAFVDILGFQRLVNQADCDEQFRLNLIDSLSKVRAIAPPASDGGESDLRAQNFSDSLILSARNTPLGLWHLLFALDSLAWNLLSKGVLTRGAVTIGNVFHNQSAIFGPSVNEAYHLESAIAKVPRVILSKKALAAADAYAHQEEEWRIYRESRIRRDPNDGVWFLNYLLELGVFNRPNGDIAEKRQHPMFVQGMHMRDLIQTQIDQAVEEPGVYEKLAWLGQYWNWEVSPADVWNDDLALAPLQLAGEEPKLKIPFSLI